jgi:hypothetical protein
MGQVIPFPYPEEPEAQIDLVEAACWAIRDLEEFSLLASEPWLREQAKDCREMLQRALTEASRNI